MGETTKGDIANFLIALADLKLTNDGAQYKAVLEVVDDLSELLLNKAEKVIGLLERINSD